MRRRRNFSRKRDSESTRFISVPFIVKDEAGYAAILLRRVNEVVVKQQNNLGEAPHGRAVAALGEQLQRFFERAGHSINVQSAEEV